MRTLFFMVIVISVPIVVLVIISIISVLVSYICALAFATIDGFRASRLVASIAPTIEAKTIILLLILLIRLLTAKSIYLTLEGTLSDIVIFQHSELLTIKKIENDFYVQYEIGTYILN